MIPRIVAVLRKNVSITLRFASMLEVFHCSNPGVDGSDPVLLFIFPYPIWFSSGVILKSTGPNARMASGILRTSRNSNTYSGVSSGEQMCH